MTLLGLDGVKIKMDVFDLIIIGILLTIWGFLSCGDEKYYSDEPSPAPSGLIFSKEMRSIIDKNCLRCHKADAFINNPDFFKKLAFKRILDNSMPPSPNPKLSQADKDVLLSL